jgi:hypothetical protein
LAFHNQRTTSNDLSKLGVGIYLEHKENSGKDVYLFQDGVVKEED